VFITFQHYHVTQRLVRHNSVGSKTKNIRPKLRPRPKLQDQDQDRGRSETGLVITPRSQTPRLKHARVRKLAGVQVVCASRHRDVVDRAVDAGADDAVYFPAEATTSQLIDATTMSGYNRMDVSFDLAGDSTSLAVAVRSLHRGGTLYELVTPQREDCADEMVTLNEVVRRGVTLRPVTAGSLEQLRELIDVLAVQRVNVNIPVELCRLEQLASVVNRLSQRTTTGRIVVKYD